MMKRPALTLLSRLLAPLPLTPLASRPLTALAPFAAFALLLAFTALAPCVAAEPGLTISKLERIELHIPFVDRVEPHMHRAPTHSERVYLYRVELSNGVVGYGENPKDHAELIPAALGRNPYELMYDDATGYGIQMALFDAVGKTVGVPAWRLLGAKVRDQTPISWWAIDMPPQDWAQEVRISTDLGYRSIKLKGRPWRDIRAQLDAVDDAAPDDYDVVIDFNGFLHSREKALPVLRDLEQAHELITGFESAIYAYRHPDDIAAMQQALDTTIYEHFRAKLLAVPAAEGFVVSPEYYGLMTSLRYDAQCEAVEKPYWLQTVGTGVMTAFSLQLSAVLKQAELPMVTCHELFEDDLLTQRIEVVDGFVRIPDGPGLGVEVDEAAIEKYRVEAGAPTPKDRYLEHPERFRVHLGQGDDAEVYDFESGAAAFRAFRRGDRQGDGFTPGTHVELLPPQ